MFVFELTPDHHHLRNQPETIDLLWTNTQELGKLGGEGSNGMTTAAGGCLCGRVRYVILGEPLRSGMCNCRSCQRYTGSAFEPFLSFPASAVGITGKLRTFEHFGDSGRPVHRRFCPNCGSGVVNADPTHGLIIVLAGTLDDPTVFKPTIEICCDTALPWARVVGERKRFPGMPG